MDDKHELDLLENALDSLAEALAKFQGRRGWAVQGLQIRGAPHGALHRANLKHHVAEKHPLLLYKDPFSKKLDRTKTIGLWDAVNFISNEVDNAISPTLRKDLEWVKELRNQIEHHKFVMDVPQVRITLGRLFRSVLEFLEEHSDVDVESKIPEDTLGTFKQLADEYEFRRLEAIKEADAIEAADTTDPSDPDSEPVRLGCPACDNPTLVKDEESPTRYNCLFCGNQESDEIPAYCDICGAQSTTRDLDAWPVDELDGKIEYRCYYCSGRYHAGGGSLDASDPLLWRVMVSALYHQKRERFLDGMDRISQAVGMLGGAAAFASLFQTDKGLSIPGAVVAVVGALALCYGPGAKARRHAELARDYKTLQAEIVRCGAPLTHPQRCEFEARVLLLESGEPAALGALVTQSQNELCVALDRAHEVTPLRWYERLFANWIDFDQTPTKAA